MAVFVVLWPYLLTTKFSCLQKNNFGHTTAIRWRTWSRVDCSNCQYNTILTLRTKSVWINKIVFIYKETRLNYFYTQYVFQIGAYIEMMSPSRAGLSHSSSWRIFSLARLSWPFFTSAQIEIRPKTSQNSFFSWRPIFIINMYWKWLNKVPFVLMNSYKWSWN